MPKIIDAFLFFQELDLLEIRLTYLDQYVDQFIIVEACQTFSGKPKDFVFEKNSQRFARFLPKIKYQKIEDFHLDYESVRDYLENAGSASHEKVLKILEQHEHYSKKDLHWVLDSYHRESIHLALDEVAKPDDITMISDLDEIPHVDIFTPSILDTVLERPRVCKQKEFRYFLNYYNDSEWLGTIIGKQADISPYSLNLLRIDSKQCRDIVQAAPIDNAGYHFTSCGGLELVREKIKSWGHQEFNNDGVLNNIEKNIASGQDIFQRETGTTLKQVELSDTRFFDSEMSCCIAQYNHLVSADEILTVKRTFIRDFLRRTVLMWSKIKYKLGQRKRFRNSL